MSILWPARKGSWLFLQINPGPLQWCQGFILHCVAGLNFKHVHLLQLSSYLFPQERKPSTQKIVSRKGYHEVGSFIYVALGAAVRDKNAENRFCFGQAVF